MRSETSCFNSSFFYSNNCMSRLFQASNSFFDSFHCFNNVFVACSIAHAETFRASECITSYGCNMSYFEKVHCEVCRIVDYAVAVFLSEVVRALREEVECSVRFVYFESRYFLCKFNDEVLAALKGLAHIFNTPLVYCP